LLRPFIAQPCAAGKDAFKQHGLGAGTERES
jgi:hypothetical protein